MDYDKNPTTQKPSDKVLDKNTKSKKEEIDIFEPSTTKTTNNNLSMRWAKKQPTKNELVESFVDLKGTLSIMSNNVLAMDKRLQTLETNFSELVTYINDKI